MISCSMYNDTVSTLYVDSKYMHTNKTHNIRPGWNECVAEYRAEACEAFESWAIAGRPRQEPVLLAESEKCYVSTR